MLAAPTSRRSLVQIQPGLLIVTPVAQRQRHLSDVEASAGSSPAGGTAEWTGVWFQHGLISRLTPVQIRPPQLCPHGDACTEGARMPRTHSGWVRLPSSPLTNGPVVQRDDTSLACWQCGFDSR